MRRHGLAILLAASLLSACRGEKQVPGRPSLEADQARSAAEWLQMEPVKLLYDYVRLDTREQNGELAGAEFLQRFFDCDGIPTETVCPAPRRCNLLVRIPGRRRDGALLLLNHIDVADAFPSFWKDARPFEGKIKLGYLYGRGAFDMKSLALAQALALRHLKRNGIVPESDVLFLAEADEESGQKWGSRWLLEHCPEWFQGVSAVLNEGGIAEMILRAVRFWGIENVQAGYGMLLFESSSREDLKALRGRWPSIQSEPVEPLPEVVLGFGMLANHLGHPLTDPLRHLDRVRRDPKELSALPDRFGSFLEARIKWLGPFSFPPESTGSFRAYVVVSTPPGLPPDSYLEAITVDARRSGVRIVDRYSSGVTTASPYLTAEGNLIPFLERIRRVTEAHYPGVPFGPTPTFGGTTTSIHYRNRGIPAYGYSPVPANITDASRRHSDDERIFLRDYLSGVDLYRDLVEEFAMNHNSSAPPAR